MKKSSIIKDLIKQGEGIDIEFKQSKDKLNKDDNRIRQSCV